MKKILLFASLALTVNAFAQIPSNGLIGWYPFFENSNDISGNCNNGTENGGVNLSTDRFGNANYAHSFDGQPLTYIDCGNDSAFNISNGSVAVSVWIKPDSGGTFPGLSAIVSKPSSVTTNIYGTYELSLENMIPKFTISNLNGTPTWYTQCIANDTLEYYDWYHLVGIADSSNQELRLYVNGQLSASTAWNGTFHSGQQKLLIGCNYKSNFGSQYMYNFMGSIDDVRLYNRTIDSLEIQSLYNDGYCYQTIFDSIAVYDTTYITVQDTNYVTVTDTNYITIYDSIAVTDTLIIDVVLGLAPPNDLNTLKVYPNPAVDHITIDNGNYTNMAGYSIEITNTLGQTVFQSPITQQQFYIDLSGWTGNGTYFIKLIDPSSTVIDTRKIILQ